MYVSVNVNGKIRKIRALETPSGTGFRDLLGHWIFEDESGARVESGALTDADRRAAIDAAKGDIT
jgi:hypothetical protein